MPMLVRSFEVNGWRCSLFFAPRQVLGLNDGVRTVSYEINLDKNDTCLPLLPIKNSIALQISKKALLLFRLVVLPCCCRCCSWCGRCSLFRDVVNARRMHLCCHVVVWL